MHRPQKDRKNLQLHNDRKHDDVQGAAVEFVNFSDPRMAFDV